VVLLRASGKRTLGEMNSFDFVITVAIGASFGRILTARSIPLAEAVTAFALLVGLQLLVTSVQMRSRWFSWVITADPTLLYYDGRVNTSALRPARLTEDQLRAAVRQHGAGSLADVGAIVMEADGKMSIIKTAELGDGQALSRNGRPRELTFPAGARSRAVQGVQRTSTASSPLSGSLH
jgi:uncharacterized membrane protein YcaP (DUF421 family)